MNQKITTKSLIKFYQKKDWYENYIKSEELQLDSIIDSIFNEQFDLPKIEKINSIYNISTLNIENKIIIRELNYHLKRLYNVNQSDRNSLVKQIKVLLEEESRPFSVTRLDIEKFYNNINKKDLYEKIIYEENLISYHHKYLLKRILFENVQFNKMKGLPFGLSLSATLSEIFMKRFDDNIKKIENVYFYSRYVDDILIFSFRTNDIRNNVEKLLPNSLKFNKDKKNQFIVIDKSDINFDYLGYKFKLVNNKLITSISDNKIKTRIIKSFLDFIKTKDFSLLEDRIKFLTGNYILTSDIVDKEIKNGIYFNYQLINEKTQLEDLTLFLRKLIFSKCNKLGRKLNIHLSIIQKRKLAKYNFLIGFNSKKTYKFDNDKINHITKCWKND